MIVARDLSADFRVVQEWELTREAFDGLLARLGPDPVSAGERYEHLRGALLRFFSWHQIQEAESCVDETLDRVARRLEAGHPIDDVAAFAYGVARLIRLERQRQSTAMQTLTSEAFVAEAATPPLEDAELRDTCLRRCLGELSAMDRNLIVSYYVGTGRERIEGRERLAAALGISENALRSRAQRLRDHLRVRLIQYLGSAVHPSAVPASHKSEVSVRNHVKPSARRRLEQFQDLPRGLRLITSLERVEYGSSV